jgi:glycosyltransferase involved in cell wall biosynthesis
VTKVIRLLPELDFGGVESRIEVQARLHDRGAYDLRVCTFHKPGKTARLLADLGVPVDVLQVSPAPRNLRAPLALARYLRKQRPDILHASISEANFHGLMAGRLAGVPVVIAEETGMPNHDRVARLAYRGVYQLASTVVAVTKAIAAYVREVDKAPAARVRVIYNCAAPSYFPSVRASSARSEGVVNVLLVGRLVPVKNQQFFLDVLAELLPSYPNVHVKIAGDGPLRSQLQDAINRKGLATRVQLLGLRTDVGSLLAEAHVFALPSLSEGCSISLIEAMASGTLAVGSDVPGIREVMGALAEDWTCPPNDPADWGRLLRRAIELDADERGRIARAGQARVYQQFSPTSYVNNLEAMYRELSPRRRDRYGIPTSRNR